jgi:hypothetical protein
LSDEVEYAEPNYEINLEPEFSNSAARNNQISEPVKYAAGDSRVAFAFCAERSNVR